MNTTPTSLRRWRRFAALALLVTGLAAGPLAGRATAAGTLHCFASWSEAAPVVVREQLAPVETLGRLVRERQAELLRTTLCRRDGTYVYQLLLRGSEGVRQITTDARRPFAP